MPSAYNHLIAVLSITILGLAAFYTMHSESHSHGHSHGHSHAHTHDAAAHANAEHFNKTAASYESIPHLVDLSNLQSQFILTQYAFDPAVTEVMNFACGTGLMDKDIAPHAKRIVGVDISQGMVDAYNTRAAALNLTDKMSASVVHLTGSDPTELDGSKFDLILCTMAYHHFSSVSRTTSMLAGFLKPGGWLLVTDLRTITPPTDADVDSSQPISGPAPGEFDKIIVEKHGFSDDVGTSLFRTAGLEEVSMQDVPGAILDGTVFGQPDTQRQIFLLKGRKPRE